MNEIINALRQFFDYFRLWVIVAPWEQVLRVRLGKQIDLLEPGIHWRFSVIDHIYCQSVRLRISGIGRQTVMSKDGRAITYTGCLGYAIKDIRKLYQSLHHAEDTLQNMVRGEIADFISSNNAKDCTLLLVASHVNGQLDFEQYGLSDAEVRITEFLDARTYRIIGDTWYGMQGSALSVEAATK